MKNTRIFIKALAIGAMATFLASCNSDGEVGSKGTAGVRVTDATVDVASVTGVFLSVREVQARGTGGTKTIAAFDSPKSFNLMDFQNGASYDLGEGTIDAGIYSELRLVLDENSYVEFEDGSSEPLTVPSGTSSGYKVKGDYQISANGRTNLVVDIDLRKAFVKTGENTYILRPTARLVNADNTGTIEGTVSAHSEDRVVIYAYAEGTWDDGESAEPAEGSTRFEGSVNSAVVANGQFTLAFMEPGKYDLIAVAYTYNEVEDTYSFKSATAAEVMVAGSVVDMLELEANATLNVLASFSF